MSGELGNLLLPGWEETKDVRDAVGRLCAHFSEDYWEERDRLGEFPEAFYGAFAESGFLGLNIPEQYGGGGGSLRQLAAALETVATSGGAINACSTVHIPLLCVPALLHHGSQEQKEEYLPAIADGTLFVSFGVTEPDAGTETTKISTRAVKQPDGSYVINGSKVWNSGALRAQKILIVARTADPGPGQKRGHGLTLFLTDIKSDSIDIRSIRKIGRNAVKSAEVFFNDLRVGAHEVVGEVDRGFYHLLGSLNGERLYVSSEALGVGRWAVREAARYAGSRVVFGRPIGQNQGVQHPLARAYAHLVAASEVLQRAITQYEEGGPRSAGTLANMAKYLTSEASFSATDSAMQVFGGYSFAREYHVGRYWIESRLQRIAPINNEVVLSYLAENELNLPRSY
jgi:acyl-CoA dehydrogenase